MATNKKKEAAALFELIDKSTLKVPKNAGALKIPTWWSSKTNPPPVMPPAPPKPSPLSRTLGQPVTPAGTSTAAPQAPDNKSLNGHANGHALPSKPIEQATPPAQSRLFQPPPSDAVPGATPSIRPPSRTPITPAPAVAPAATPAAVVPAPPVPAAEPAAEVKETEPIGEAELPERAQPVIERRPLTPPGMSTGRAWQPTKQNLLANVPPPVLYGAAAVGALLLFLLLVVIFHHRGGGTTTTQQPAQNSIDAPIPAPGSPDRTAAPGPTDGGLLQGHVAQQNNPTPGPGQGAGPGPGPAPASTGARVYEPGAFPFSPDSVYVVIATSSSETVTRRNAKFFADHNVDVAIERAGDQFKLIATKGFPNNPAAEPYVQKIRDLGKLHPDYRPNRKVFSDAAVRRITMSAR